MGKCSKKIIKIKLDMRDEFYITDTDSVTLI